MFLWNYLVTKLTGSVVWRDVHLLGNNIFLSIAMWVSMIWSIDTVKNFWKTNIKKSILFILFTIIIALASFFTEASIYGFAMFLVFYFLVKSIFFQKISSSFASSSFTSIGSEWVVFSQTFTVAFGISFALSRAAFPVIADLSERAT